jgi:hypothetical protein
MVINITRRRGGPMSEQGAGGKTITRRAVVVVVVNEVVKWVVGQMERGREEERRWRAGKWLQ